MDPSMSHRNDAIAPLLQDCESATLMQAYEAAGYELRFIGGCVRDSLLDRPIKDIDLATTALPEETFKILKTNNLQAIPTGIAHGTVTAVVDGLGFEITTLRQDIHTDGRHADVSFTTDWETDAARRDFTINALSVDKNGVLYDYFDGQKDLETHVLRFIGDPARRIEEDYLRILRYFRFASQLNWPLQNKKELELCASFAPQLKSLSRERIQAELLKLLSGDGCVAMIELMRDYGIWDVLLDAPISLSALRQVVEMEKKYGENDPVRRLIALVGWKNHDKLHRITVPSNKEKKRLENLRSLCALTRDNRSLNRRLYNFGTVAVKDFYYLIHDDTHFKEIDAWRKPVFPVTAADVVPFTGGEGPAVGVVLRTLENYWVDHAFEPSRDELTGMIKGFVENDLDQ